MNYYDIFGIKPTASLDDINAAHKSLAKMYHPDINDSEDAHERMALLNEANEVLSDTVRREEYNRKIGVTQQQWQRQEVLSARHTQILNAKWPREMKIPQERAGKAELLRRKAEARLKNVEAAKARRMEQEKLKAEEDAVRKRQRRADFEKQHIVNELSSLVMGGNTQQKKKSETDTERHHATKVLLSLVRNENEGLRRMTEEAERKQRVEEILSMVKQYKDEADPERFV